MIAAILLVISLSAESDLDLEGQFVQGGLVFGQVEPGSEVRFDANPDPHQHFLCTRYGGLSDIPEECFPVQVGPGASGFEVHRFRITAEGICPSCRSAT